MHKLQFDIVTKGSSIPPTITTNLRPNNNRRDGASWKIEVLLEGGQLMQSKPEPIEHIHVPRSIIQDESLNYLPASMPHFESKIRAKPRLIRLPKARPYTIKFGDLHYEPATIFPPDRRKSYYDESYPWRCLVRVRTKNGYGSGVLIGRRHVLTASHVIDWSPNAWITVDVLYRNGNSLASAHVIKTYAETQVTGSIENSENDEDYAVVVLNQPLGEWYGYLGVRTYDSSWDDKNSNWQSIGYPGDWGGETPVYQTNFFLNELGSDFGPARLL